MINVWNNNGSGWNVQSTYKPLSGRFYMNLPVELRSQKKGLINLKKKDQKKDLWCHVRHINPSKKHPERI